MKKILIILGISLVLGTSYYFYFMQSDKILLKDFYAEIANDSIKTDEIVSKFVKNTSKGKVMAVFILNYIREEYKKDPGEIVVCKVDENEKKEITSKIKINEGEKLYNIQFNKNLKLDLIVNKESKIVIYFILDKGNGGTLSNERSDE